MFMFRDLRRAWGNAIDDPLRVARLEKLTDAELLAVDEPAERAAAVPAGGSRRRRDPGPDPAHVDLPALRRRIAARAIGSGARSCMCWSRTRRTRGCPRTPVGARCGGSPGWRWAAPTRPSASVV